jgi:hypothetical protein
VGSTVARSCRRRSSSAFSTDVTERPVPARNRTTQGQTKPRPVEAQARRSPGQKKPGTGVGHDEREGGPIDRDDRSDPRRPPRAGAGAGASTAAGTGATGPAAAGSPATARPATAAGPSSTTRSLTAPAHRLRRATTADQPAYRVCGRIGLG